MGSRAAARQRGFHGEGGGRRGTRKSVALEARSTLFSARHPWVPGSAAGKLGDVEERGLGYFEKVGAGPPEVAAA